MSDVKQALTEARAAADGLPLHVLILPALCHVSDSVHRAELERVGFDAAAYRRGAHQERLRAVCDELGLPVHDATPWFETLTDPATPYLPDRGHLSVRGNELVAEHLANELAPLWR